MSVKVERIDSEALIPTKDAFLLKSQFDQTEKRDGKNSGSRIQNQSHLPAQLVDHLRRALTSHFALMHTVRAERKG